MITAERRATFRLIGMAVAAIFISGVAVGITWERRNRDACPPEATLHAFVLDDQTCCVELDHIGRPEAGYSICARHPCSTLSEPRP